MRSATFRLLTLILVSSISAHAQILWGSATTVSGDSDISTDGSFIDAASMHAINGESTQIGDTTFTDFGSQLENTSNVPRSATDGTISVTADSMANLESIATPDANYDNAIGYATFINNNDTGTISFANLTAGTQYEVQVWSYYGDAGFSPLLSGTNPTVLDSAEGQFAIGTFTPTTSTFSFTYGYGGDEGGLINAVALRELPEPSTWLLVGIGATLVVWRLRRGTLA